MVPEDLRSTSERLGRLSIAAGAVRRQLAGLALAGALALGGTGIGLFALSPTVDAATVPTVTGISPNSGPPGGSTSVTISGTNFTGATSVDFGPALGASNINATLQAGGTIEGSVTDSTGAGLQGICVTAADSSAPSLGISEGISATGGAYSINGLASGTYSVTFDGCQSPQNYLAQTVPAVSVSAGQTTSGVNATMTPNSGGIISGTVTDSSGVGISGICVSAFDPATGASESTDTGTGGSYAVDGLASGSYTVTFEDCQDLGNYAFVTDSSVSVTETFTTSLDATMGTGGAVSGTVSNGANVGLAGICVSASGSAGSAFTTTGSGGGYSLDGLATGSYSVVFEACQSGNYVPIVDSSVAVTAPNGTVLNVVMVPGLTISGTVSDTLGNPLGSICVQALSTSGVGFGFAQTNSTTGTYSVPGLSSGTYQVSFQSCGNGDYAPLTYPSAVTVGASSATYTVNSATSITATSPAESAGTVDVTVSTPAGTSATSSADQFTYVAPATGPTVTGLSPTSGSTSGGTSVAITGTGFTGATAVAFGSEPAATYTVNSATSITATSPSQAAGTVNVTVTTSTGTTALSSADQFTYMAPTTPPPPPSGPSAGPTLSGYIPLSPARICDTRAGNPSGLSGAEAQCDGNSLAAGVPLDVTVAGLVGVPVSGVSGVMLNVTVTGPTSGGYLSVYPAGEPAPLASNLNFTKGETVANAVEVGLSATGQVAVITNASSADVVIDVEGYVATPATAGTGLYNGVGPTRICDTRAGTGSANQCTGHTMGPDSTLPVQVAGLAGVPSNATAVALSVTVTNTAGAGGYLTVFPGGTPPTASNLDWAPGETVANLVVTPLNSGGGVTLYNYAGTADVIVDVLGYYTAAGGSGAQFTPLAEPTRICDTRDSGPANQCTGHTMPGNSTMTVQVTGLAGVPAGAKAVVINVTATNTTGGGYLTVYPSGARPLASNLNWAAGTTVPNLVIATLSSGGGITIYNSAGSTDIVIDVLGYYS